MFLNRKLINGIHERALKVVYQDHNSTFNELLSKVSSFKVHDHNLHKLLIEIFEVEMKLAPKIINEVFDILECSYHLRNELRFKSQNFRTLRYGTETEAFLDSRILSYMPSELKESKSPN